MAVQPQFLVYVLEQLAGLGGVEARRMFGGVGLYHRDLFFGLIDDDTVYFKTDETNAAEYQARRMPRFMPPASRPVGPLGYHQLPADVLEDAEMLVEWARRSVTVAVRAQAKAPARRARRSASRKTRGSS